MHQSNLRKLTLTGILISLVFVVTSFTKIPLPVFVSKEAYVHAGDSVIYISAMLLGPLGGALVSGIGSFFADLYLGSPVYMIPTLLIKGMMGFIAGLFLYKSASTLRTFVGLVLAGLWMSLGYYFFDVFFFHIDWRVYLYTIPINFAQAVLGMIIYFSVSKVVKKFLNLT
jgi:uncharacterized membrane protein